MVDSGGERSAVDSGGVTESEVSMPSVPCESAADTGVEDLAAVGTSKGVWCWSESDDGPADSEHRDAGERILTTLAAALKSPEHRAGMLARLIVPSPSPMLLDEAIPPPFGTMHTRYIAIYHTWVFTSRYPPRAFQIIDTKNSTVLVYFHLFLVIMMHKLSNCRRV